MRYHVTINIPDALEPQVRILEDFETFVSIVTIHALQNIDKKDSHNQLAEAAQLMLKDYTEDQELTCFTSLDGEPFHE